MQPRLLIFKNSPMVLLLLAGKLFLIEARAVSKTPQDRIPPGLLHRGGMTKHLQTNQIVCKILHIICENAQIIKQVNKDRK